MVRSGDHTERPRWLSSGRWSRTAAKNPSDGGSTVIKRTLVARSGNRFKLNDGLRDNLWLSGEPTCASLFPLLTSEQTSDVVIENNRVASVGPRGTAPSDAHVIDVSGTILTRSSRATATTAPCYGSDHCRKVILSIVPPLSPAQIRST